MLTYGADGSSYGPQGPQTNTLTVGTSHSAAAVSFIPYNNATTVVAWTNVAPNAGGRIVFTIAGSGMLNLMKVSQVTAAQPPATVQITNHLNGNSLSLTWLAGQGWRLVIQTNSLSAGINPNPAAWSTVSGSPDGSYSITLNHTFPAVFYRLVNP